MLSKHTVTDTKSAAGGFGPYVLKYPERKDINVDRMTLAVFDVDYGATPETVQACRDLLVAADLAQHWYTTFSHTPEKQSWRLVIPLDAEWLVDKATWQRFRRSMISEYQIPADPKKCSGLSHFYYLPSCPPGATPEVVTFDGYPTARSAVVYPVTLSQPVDIPCPPEPTQPIDLRPFKTSLRARAKKLRGAGQVRKADALDACLDGRPLASHGERTTTSLSVAGTLAWAFPDEHPETLYRIMAPSVALMIAEGSSITKARVMKMLESARANYFKNKAEDEALRVGWGKGLRELVANTPEVDPVTGRILTNPVARTTP